MKAQKAFCDCRRKTISDQTASAGQNLEAFPPVPERILPESYRHERIWIEHLNCLGIQFQAAELHQALVYHSVAHADLKKWFIFKSAKSIFFQSVHSIFKSVHFQIRKLFIFKSVFKLGNRANFKSQNGV